MYMLTSSISSQFQRDMRPTHFSSNIFFFHFSIYVYNCISIHWEIVENEHVQLWLYLNIFLKYIYYYHQNTFFKSTESKTMKYYRGFLGKTVNIRTGEDICVYFKQLISVVKSVDLETLWLEINLPKGKPLFNNCLIHSSHG